MTKNTTSLLPLQKLEGKPKLIITEEVLNQIRTLCSEINTVEWSGVLFHTSKGNVTNPETFICTAKYVLPMDKGTAGYTEYAFDENFVNAISEKPELLNYRTSHVHSQHSMSTFFSGTDNEELQENAPNYDYYLSLIVNNKGDYSCRIAFKCKVTGREIIIRGAKGKANKIKTPDTEVICYYDVEIEEQCSVYGDEFFMKNLERIKTTVKTTNFVSSANDWDHPHEVKDVRGNTFRKESVVDKMFPEQKKLDFGSNTNKPYNPNPTQFLKYLLIKAYGDDCKTIHLGQGIKDIISNVEKEYVTKYKSIDKAYEQLSNGMEEIEIFFDRYLMSFQNSEAFRAYEDDEETLLLGGYDFLKKFFEVDESDLGGLLTDLIENKLICSPYVQAV
jgi:hypothetical protein